MRNELRPQRHRKRTSKGRGEEEGGGSGVGEVGGRRVDFGLRLFGCGPVTLLAAAGNFTLLEPTFHNTWGAKLIVRH